MLLDGQDAQNSPGADIPMDAVSYTCPGVSNTHQGVYTTCLGVSDTCPGVSESTEDGFFQTLNPNPRPIDGRKPQKRPSTASHLAQNRFRKPCGKLSDKLSVCAHFPRNGASSGRDLARDQREMPLRD